MLRTILLFAGSVFFYKSWGQTDSTLSLYRCIQIAQASNLEVQRSLITIDDAEKRLSVALGSKVPNISASLTQGINMGKSIDPTSNLFINKNNFYGNYSLSGSLLVWNGNAKNLEIAQSKTEHESSRLNHKIIRQQITLRVAILYLDVLMNEKHMKISQNESETTKQIIEKLEFKYSHHTILQSELSDYKSKYSATKIAIIQRSEALESAKLELSKLINIRYPSQISFLKLEDSILTNDYSPVVEDVYEKAQTVIPTIEYSKLKMQSAQKAVEIVDRKRYPTISFSFGLASNYSNFASESKLVKSTVQPAKDFVFLSGVPYNVFSLVDQYSYDRIPFTRQVDNNLNYYGGMSVQLPIVSSNQFRKQKDLVKNQVKKALIENESAESELRSQVQHAIITRNAALRRYKELQNQVQYNKQSFESVNERFNNGMSTSLELLIVQNNLDNSVTNMVSTKYDFLIRDIVLKIYKGEF